MLNVDAPFEPVRVGVVGCGTISARYLSVMRGFPILRVLACADLLLERARSRAEEFGVPRACTVRELLADPEIEVVLNLTIPQAHAEIGLAALEAGKSVYNEKPLAVRREDARRMLDLAEARELRVGASPDTFLGGGLQTCRKLLDDGWIGRPVAAIAAMLSPGPESWHPDPAFYYQPGAGPLFDMGPYYLTALISLLGPVRRVAGMVAAGRQERMITSEEQYGQHIRVNTPTHVTGALEFASGAVATLVTSFDAWASVLPPIEVHGTQGSLRAPDPNRFDGPIWVRRAGFTSREKDKDGTWAEVPLTHGYAQNSRGIGLADMAYALRSGRPHRASGEMAYHVLDVMEALYESAENGAYVELTSTCPRPAPLPLGLLEGTLDEITSTNPEEGRERRFAEEG
jgi:predicted dehydrogenase